MPVSKKFAAVTGAGSGIGRSAAVALANAGFAVALIGRRAEPLLETKEAVGTAGGEAQCIPGRRCRRRIGRPRVFADRRRIRAARRALQQRRPQRGGRPPGRLRGRFLERCRGHQSDRRLSVRSGRLSLDERTVPSRRTNHQQRIDLSALAEAAYHRLYGNENMEPNLPAPISATRTGRPAAWRALSRCERFVRNDPAEEPVAASPPALRPAAPSIPWSCARRDRHAPWRHP